MKNQIKSEEEIGNILLAEFMGWGYRGIYHTPFEDAGMCNGEPSSICYDRNLLFNSDWNWLMLVVEKILNICQESDEMEKYYIITDAIPEITSVFAACVEFAKWYKNNSHE